MIYVTASYAWFLPKAYAWLTRLIDSETLRKIAEAEDVRTLTDILRKTRLSEAIPPIEDAREIGKAIQRFYKQEIAGLLGLVPEGFRKLLEKTLLHIAIAEAFSAAKAWIKGTRDLMQIAETSLVIPRAFFERLSITKPRSIDSLKTVLGEFTQGNDVVWAEFILRGLEEVKNEPVDVAETFLYLKAIEEALTSLSEAKRGYSVDTRSIVCPYFDLEGVRTLVTVIYSLGGLPRPLHQLRRAGCMDIPPEALSKESVTGIYKALAKRYKVAIGEKEDLANLDLRLGEAMRSKMMYYARKAFFTYPYSVNIPISLLLLLLNERAYLLRSLARIEYRRQIR